MAGSTWGTGQIVARLGRAGAAIAVVGGSLLLGGTARAQGSWLDQTGTPENWNWAGMGIPMPAAPAPGGLEPNDPFVSHCQTRPLELAEDHQLNDLGWKPISAYQGGWGMVLIEATSTFDGMCRPWGFDVFVFVDGTFAGTISPVEMNSRLDGALATFDFFGPDYITAQFTRYLASDPLCCPTGGKNTVTYKIEHTADGPVLTPTGNSHSAGPES